jgi:hypothetical protein
VQLKDDPIEKQDALVTNADSHVMAVIEDEGHCEAHRNKLEVTAAEECTTSESREDDRCLSIGGMDWNTVFGDDKSDCQVSCALRRASMMYVEQVCAQNHAGSDYFLFDPERVEGMLGEGNVWAGATHWKFMAKRKTRVQSTTADKENDKPDTNGTSSKARKRHVAFKLNFEENPIAVEAFAAPAKKRCDPTKLTSAALAKALKLAREGALNLPQDAELDVRLRISMHSLLILQTAAGLGSLQTLHSRLQDCLEPGAHTTNSTPEAKASCVETIPQR